MRDLHTLPKAHLHLHFTGSMRHGTLLELAERDGISLPESGTDASVVALGDRKNDAFNAVLERDGVDPYPGTVALLDHLRDLGTPLAIVSSSANAPAVLDAAGLSDRFSTVVDGRVAAAEGLPGKPAPDTFQHAADALGVPREAAVVVEDAVSGVRAGAAGGFALVVGVDRGAGHDVLAGAGADVVVSDLLELVPASSDGASA